MCEFLVCRLAELETILIQVHHHRLVCTTSVQVHHLIPACIAHPLQVHHTSPTCIAPPFQVHHTSLGCPISSWVHHLRPRQAQPLNLHHLRPVCTNPVQVQHLMPRQAYLIHFKPAEAHSSTLIHINIAPLQVHHTSQAAPNRIQVHIITPTVAT